MRDRQTRELVAVKYIERGEKIDENVQREITNHCSLRHPNIVRFKEVILTPTHLAIVIEYASGGELFECICNAGRFSENEITISECVLDSERDCKGNSQFTEKSFEITIQGRSDNDVRESNKYCLQKDVNAREMSRTESEIEFAFNDEDIFKSCLALSELSPPTGEDEKHCNLYPHLEEEEKEYDLVGSEKKITGSLPDITHDSSSLHVRDSISSFGSERSSPIHVPGPKIEGRGVLAKFPGSLPNMGSHFSDGETSDAKGLFSRSLDINSSFCVYESRNTFVNT